MTRQAREGEWQMRDGTFIRIRRMSDSHLANAIAMMERNAKGHAFALAMSAGNYASQHDSMGGRAAEEAADELFDLMDEAPEDCASELWPKYNELVAERERRSA
jgi:hypothetical protein